MIAHDAGNVFLQQHFGIDPARVVEKFITGSVDNHESKNSELKPYELAEQYTDAMEGMPEAEDVVKSQCFL